MIGVTTKFVCAARQSWRRSWTPVLAGVGIALAATACGGAGAATPSTSAAASVNPTPTSTAAAFPGVVGTAAAVSGASMEVQNPTSGQVTVTFTATTPITETVAVTSSDVTVGSCVSVVGTAPASGSAASGSASGGSATRSVTATTVTVSSPVNGSCNAAAGFGGFGGFGGGAGGGFGGPRGTFSPRPGASARPRPTGSRGAFGFGGGANGKVSSLSAGGFVVQGRNRAQAANAGTGTSTTVITTAATKYLKVVTVHPSALKVGQCITALGTANSIGAVAARTIRISQPGPNGCVTGFGRRGGFGGSTGGAASNA